ncbi:MAG TPA: IspD/TarI family cytidylyltransferase, partial [Candidatus Krumholzibacteria bacterium]|nr:IspD/TarI family cytidylyltransferase [Candidatus Krumholzibacteria bacterium]
RAMLVWSAEMLAASARVSGLVLVAPAGQEAAFTALLAEQAARKLRAAVSGGNSRQDSVYNGLERVPEGTTHVLIHDAARPCLSPALRDRVIDALASHDAVVPAVPVTDTLIRDMDAGVDAILDRVNLAGVQTPQGFRLELIRRAHRIARERGFKSSDDGSLVLALAENVATVPGERSNLKVTYRDDVIIAEAILKKGAA